MLACSRIHRKELRSNPCLVTQEAEGITEMEVQLLGKEMSYWGLSWELRDPEHEWSACRKQNQHFSWAHVIGTKLPRAKESPWSLLWAMVTDTHVLFTLPERALPCIPQMRQYTYTQYSVVICIKTLVFCYILLFNKTMSLPRTHSKENLVSQICTDFYFMQNYLKQYKIENIKHNKRKRAT